MIDIAHKTDWDVIIVGGGIAGLVSSIILGTAGKKVLLLEKKTYPYHKVCGEYVSNEVLAYLQHLGFDPFRHGAANITKLRVSTPRGKNLYADLDLGAFALSRYTMDYALAQLAQQKGVELLTGNKVTDVQLGDNRFTVTANGNGYTAKFVIGSWGKRETLDKKLKRSFIDKRTRYMGVKYHIRTDYPVNEIGLDSFDGGYCGIVKIEGDKYNLCNFYRRPIADDKHTSIKAFEEEVVFKNPIIKNIFKNADFLFDAPVVINEVCFAAKPAVEQHILMCGDTAGLITPLCGNGMSMAITAARMLAGLLLQSGLLDKDVVQLQERTKLEAVYKQQWAKQFQQRLSVGRTIQGFVGYPVLTELSIRMLKALPPLQRSIIKATHGKPLQV